MHQLANDDDIILDSERDFSYNQHLNLSKKILKLNSPEGIELLRQMEKPEKNVFPSVEFIFMSEEEKERYLGKGDISYIKNYNNEKDERLFNNINNNDLEEKYYDNCDYSINSVNIRRSFTIYNKTSPILFIVNSGYFSKFFILSINSVKKEFFLFFIFSSPYNFSIVIPSLESLTWYPFSFNISRILSDSSQFLLSLANFLCSTSSFISSGISILV